MINNSTDTNEMNNRPSSQIIVHTKDHNICFSWVR